MKLFRYFYSYKFIGRWQCPSLGPYPRRWHLISRFFEVSPTKVVAYEVRTSGIPESFLCTETIWPRVAVIRFWTRDLWVARRTLCHSATLPRQIYWILYLSSISRLDCNVYLTKKHIKLMIRNYCYRFFLFSHRLVIVPLILFVYFCATECHIIGQMNILYIIYYKTLPEK